MNVIHNLSQYIGHTPLLHLERLEQLWGLQAELYAKLEYFNPWGSVKDRAALRMIGDAEERGLLQPGALVIEPTSGNTGVGLAGVCALRGYRLVLTMPESMSVERRILLAALGAELVLTPAAEGMAGAVARAEAIHQEHPGSWIASQFDNPANAEAHVRSTAPELLDALDGQLDAFVACFGTGGTITGIGHSLKKSCPNCRIVGVEPEASPLVSRGVAGPHPIQGIGANFIPSLLDISVMDEIFTVSGEDAFETCRILGRREALLVGISSGAAVWAAAQLARRPEMTGKRIVVLCPDTGERYLSSNLYTLE